MTGFLLFYGATVGTCVLMITHGRPVVAGAGLSLIVFFHIATAVFAAWWRASGRDRVPPSFSRRLPPARQRRRKARVATILDDAQ